MKDILEIMLLIVLLLCFFAFGTKQGVMFYWAYDGTPHTLNVYGSKR